MNKTLLLILCDFLLLTIISMWKMDEADVGAADAPAAEASESESVAAMAMMEQDLLNTLQYSLEEEQAESSELAESLEEKAAELERRQAEIEQRESRIQNLEENLTEAQRREQALAQEREQLAEQAQSLESRVAEARAEYEEVTQQLEQTESQALQNQAQSRQLQAELQRKLEEIAAKEAALAEANDSLSSAQQKVRELDVRVQMTEQEKQFLQESVSNLKGEIVAERTERQKLQEQADVLAQGVTELASNSQDLREELRSSFEINANQLFSSFQQNQVLAEFAASQSVNSRYADTLDSAATLLVSDGENIYALMHIESAPFDLNSRASLIRTIHLRLQRQGATVRPGRMHFLALDPRIVAIPVTAEQAAELGGKPYLTALNPFKFPEAVLINKEGDYYGEVEFKLDSDTPGFVKMQNKVFSSLFGEFSPSTGDLVLSKTGELLGIMVNKRYCALVDNFVIAETLEVDGALNQDRFERILNTLNNTLRSFPNRLR